MQSAELVWGVRGGYDGRWSAGCGGVDGKYDVRITKDDVVSGLFFAGDSWRLVELL